MARILLIEDEPALRRGLTDLLVFHGHQPTGIADGADGLREAQKGGYALLIVDGALPSLDGFEVCRAIRATHPEQPILLLTARGREEDILYGFQSGCDDYVCKPFRLPELLARIEALLRRAPKQVDEGGFGPLRLDVDNLEIEGEMGKVALSTRQVDVLRHVYAHRDRIVSREELLREVWGYARVDGVETRAVDMHMVKLRRALEAVWPDPIIETVRGAGYRLLPPFRS